MKRCPKCNSTFEDTQRFCANDGTPLLDDSPGSYDPYKTVVASPSTPRPSQPSAPPPSAPQPVAQPEPARPERRDPVPAARDFQNEELPGEAAAPAAAWSSPPPAAPAPFSPPPVGVSPQPSTYTPPAAAVSAGKLMPGAIGGVVMGIASVIPFLNLGCCVWGLLGGGLAAFLYNKRTQGTAQAMEGLIVGLIAAGIGTLILLVVGIPLTMLLSSVMGAIGGGGIGNLVGSAAGGLISAVIQDVLFAVILLIFSSIGGYLTLVLLNRK